MSKLQIWDDENELFYLVKTPIKYFDDNNFDEELKNKIFLVDLPGCDTNENYLMIIIIKLKELYMKN